MTDLETLHSEHEHAHGDVADGGAEHVHPHGPGHHDAVSAAEHHEHEHTHDGADGPHTHVHGAEHH